MYLAWSASCGHCDFHATAEANKPISWHYSDPSVDLNEKYRISKISPVFHVTKKFTYQ